MNNFERAESMWLEPEDNEPKVVGACNECEEEFFEGDEYVNVNGDMVCKDIDCLVSYCGGIVKDAELED